MRYPLLMAAVCLVFLGFSEVKSQAQLGGPPSIVVQPLGISVQNGGMGLITATAASFTSMTFGWYFNGHPVPTTNCSVVNLSVVLGTASTLTIRDVSAASAGSYTLYVTNAAGKVESSPATLIVLANTVTNVVSFIASGTGKVLNGFKIQLSAPTGSNVVIQASTDLQNWTPISTNTATSGSVSYTDTAATNLNSRYYRARIE